MYYEISPLLKELVKADGSDFATVEKSEKELFKSIVKDLFKRNNLKVNEDEGDNTLIPRNKQKNDETLGDEFSASLL